MEEVRSQFDLSKMKLLQEVKIKDRQIEELTQQQVTTTISTHRHINASLFTSSGNA